MFETIASALATVLLFSLLVYTMTRRRTATGVALAMTTFLLAAIEALDRILLSSSFDPYLFKKAVIFLESFLPITSLFYSFTFARLRADKLSFLWKGLLGLSVIFPLSVVLFPTDSFFYSPDLQIDRTLFLGSVGYWFYMSLMLYCVLALMNLEATFSATTGSDRWKIKFEVIGMSGMLSVLIFYFSQGLLYRTINMNLIPVRSGVFIIASLLIGYSKLFRGNNVRIAVSRFVLYRSLTLLSVGFYLLILGLIGEGMRYLGISFSRDLTIFIAFASGIVMVLVLLSEQLRRRVKVFISKHFFRHKHDYREEWLQFTKRLSSCMNIADVQGAILTTYQKTFGLKGASLYLYHKEKRKYVFAEGRQMLFAPSDFSASDGLVSYFTGRTRILNLSDEEYHPTSEEGDFFREAGVRLLVPLIANEGVEGVVVLGDQLAPEKIIFEDYDLMRAFAEQSVQAIRNFRLSEELAEAREVAAVAKISAFIIHDLKNLLSTLSLIVDNAKDYMSDPNFQQDMLQSLDTTIMKMRGIISRLTNLREKKVLHQEPLDLYDLARESTKMMDHGRVTVKGGSVHATGDGEEIQKVVLNMVLNALEASDGQSPVLVEVGLNDWAYIRIKDSGCGMTKEFVTNHLFKPFRTTKGKGIGIGLYQCRQIVEVHGGRIEVESETGRGSVFTVYLPLTEEPESILE